MDLLSAIAEGDRQALGDMVADDVVFHSPATTYRGRDQVVDLLAIAGSVIGGPTPTREPITIGAGETLTFLTTSVGDEQLDGVLVEVRHGDGRIAEITMLLRPLAAVETAMRLTARGLTEAAERQP
jgi:SnoaL-like domain